MPKVVKTLDGDRWFIEIALITKGRKVPRSPSAPEASVTKNLRRSIGFIIYPGCGYKE